MLVNRYLYKALSMYNTAKKAANKNSNEKAINSEVSLFLL